uniref:Reverse transcriptase zinc-binding domain-containing protein n=1 Tax=Nicotiana tabacum TaxID=4097 RepID=A0A1S4D0G9_TOBAC|nr:PREDICTED: uncharacterized protein LOC107824621 [Nicotiana tabacum]
MLGYLSGYSIFLAAHRRLLTRLRRWGYLEDTTCSLCNTEEETIDHLFFKCSFSTQVWAAVLDWQGINRQVMVWDHELEWAERHCKGRSSKAEIYRMTLADNIYYIWQERNARIFQAKQRNVATITRLLMQEIHYRGKLKQRLKGRLLELNYYPIVRIDM